ncbi:MAG: HAD hydrolase-like protein [Tepidisphaeraceae bacterium]|jgi:4-nitrophenyl phosphatase
MSVDFAEYDAVLLDLDGTVYHEDHPLPGAVQLIARLQHEGRKFACLSNSTTSPARVLGRLRSMGIDMDGDRIYTAGAAAVDYVLDRFCQPGRRPRVYNLATQGVQELLQGRADGVGGDEPSCDAVIIGAPANRYATADRQRTALVLLRGGAAAVGICADRVYPSPRGLEFGSGALSLMLGYAAGVEPIFCGKPQRIFFDELCRRLGVSPQRCILIGDNLEADVAGAKGVGMRTILTLSGVTRREELVDLPPDQQPDYIITDLRQL